MNLEKAIEILELQNRLTSPNLEPDLIAANSLGTEALKRLDYNRKHNFPLDYSPLPGETIE